MLLVGDCIVSDDVKNVKFCCDLSECKGCCCVEGDAGAPLLEEEIKVLTPLIGKIEPFMEPRAVDIIRKEGFWDKDCEGELCTRIIEGRECVFVKYENSVAYCAIERAFRKGVIDFIKPVSCHLYPIRVKDYGEFQALNYNKWNICSEALKSERAEPLYKLLKEPLIRRFSKQWYEELVEAVESSK